MKSIPLFFLLFFFLFLIACGLSCDNGYTLNSTECRCTLTDICAAISPCDNGECLLGLSADEYTCNCTGTIYTGSNCSGSILY